MGPYYRAELVELLTPDGARVEISEFDVCLGVGEVAATRELDRAVREWMTSVQELEEPQVSAPVCSVGERLTDVFRIEWAGEALGLAILALIVLLFVRHRRFFQFLDAGHPARHSGSYKGHRWTANTGFNGVLGPYYRAELVELLTPDGARVEISEFDVCLGVGEVAATRELDRAVREWIDNVA